MTPHTKTTIFCLENLDSVTVHVLEVDPLSGRGKGLRIRKKVNINLKESF